MTEDIADMGRTMQLWREIQNKRLSVAKNQKQINSLKKENRADIPLIDKMLTDFNCEMSAIANANINDVSTIDTVNDSIDEDTVKDDDDVDDSDLENEDDNKKKDKETDEDNEDDETDTDDSDDDDDEDDESDSKD